MSLPDGRGAVNEKGVDFYRRLTDTLPSAEGFYLPLLAGENCVGVLGVKPPAEATLPASQRDLRLRRIAQRGQMIFRLVMVGIDQVSTVS